MEPVQVTLYICIYVTEDDNDPHNITLGLERPSGEFMEHPLIMNHIFSAKYKDMFRSSNLIGYVRVKVREQGSHVAIVKMDGVEVARAFFTLRALDETIPGQMPNPAL